MRVVEAEYATSAPIFKDQTVAPLGLGLNRRGISLLLRSIWVDMPAIIIYLVPIQKWWISVQAKAAAIWQPQA